MHFPPQDFLDFAVEAILFVSVAWVFFMRTLPGIVLRWLLVGVVAAIAMFAYGIGSLFGWVVGRHRKEGNA